MKNNLTQITSVERTRKLSVLLHKAAATMQQQKAMVGLSLNKKIENPFDDKI